MTHITLYLCNRDSTEKPSSNSELESEYLTWEEFRVTNININLTVLFNVLQEITVHTDFFNHSPVSVRLIKSKSCSIRLSEMIPKRMFHEYLYFDRFFSFSLYFTQALLLADRRDLRDARARFAGRNRGRFLYADVIIIPASPTAFHIEVFRELRRQKMPDDSGIIVHQ